MYLQKDPPKPQTNNTDEGLMLEMSDLYSLYSGQFTLSTQSIKPNIILLYFPPTQHHSFLRNFKLFKNKSSKGTSPIHYDLTFHFLLFQFFLNRFLELVQPTDGEEYSKTSFLGARIERFSFIIITQQWHPPEHLMEQTYPIRVIIPSRPDV